MNQMPEEGLPRVPLSTRAAQHAVERIYGAGAKLHIEDGYAFLLKPGAKVVERWKISDETLRTLARIDEGYEVPPEGFQLHFVPPEEEGGSAA
jgi:hypothetical protein